MKGCCPACIDGASGEEYTNGQCWGCRGTGHSHLGPCGGFWLWWLNHNLGVLFTLWIFMIVAVVPLSVNPLPVWGWLYAGISLTWWAAWLTLDLMYDRRWRKRQ